jgi:hypothetical protein
MPSKLIDEALRKKAEAERRAGNPGGSTAAESSGSLFDPTQHPTTASNAQADNGFNQANFWSRYNQMMNRQMGKVGDADARSQQSRAAADAFVGNRTATPEWGGVADWIDPTGGQMYNPGARPDFETDDDLASRYGRFADMIGYGPGQEGGPVTADSVAGHGAAFNQYAQGAGSIFQRDLQNSIRKMQENAAASGRLGTGYWDLDQGEFATGLARDFNDQMLMKALDAAALDQDAAVGNADRNLKAALGNQANAGDLRNQRLDLLRWADDRGVTGSRDRQAAYEFDADFGRDSYLDARDFSRGTYERDRDFSRGVYEGDRDFTEDRYRNDRDFLEDRSRYDQGIADVADLTYLDIITSGRDWRNQQAAITRETNANKGFGGFMKNYVAPLAPLVASAVGGPAAGDDVAAGTKAAGGARMPEGPSGVPSWSSSLLGASDPSSTWRKRQGY